MAKTSPTSEDSGQSDVFISYSRKDQEFVRRLEAELQERGRKAWVDWQGIRPIEEFMQAIYRAIESTDTFIFILSPDSVASKICERELEHAVKHKKRMIPVVARAVDAAAVPEPLAKLNWIVCPTVDDVGSAATTLASALDTDLEWVRAHTRFLTHAIEWETNKESNSFVLRGEDLHTAEKWLAQADADKKRVASALQIQYIQASRGAASKRQRIVFGAIAGGALLALVLAILAWNQRSEAEKQRTVAQQQEKVAKGNAVEAGRQQELAKKKARQANEALSQSDFARGIQLAEGGREPEALAFLARSVRLTGHAAAATRLGSLLIDHTWALPCAEEKQIDAESAIYSPDGTRVLAILPDGKTAALRDERTSQNTAPLIRYKRILLEADFSPDSSRLLTLGDDIDPAGKDESGDYRVRLWDCISGQRVGSDLKVDPSGTRILFSPDSRWVAFREKKGTHILETRTGRETLFIAYENSADNPFTDLEFGSFSADGERFMSRTRGGRSVRLWQVGTGKQIGSTVVLSPRNLAVAPKRWQAGLALFNSAAPGKTKSSDEQEEPERLAEFSADGRSVLTFDQNGARIWDSVTGQPRSELITLPGKAPIYTASFSPDGGRVLVVGRDGSMFVWDTVTLKLVLWGYSADIAEVETTHDELPKSISAPALGRKCQAHFSADGRWIVTTNDDGTQRHVWSAFGAPAIPLQLYGKGMGLDGFSFLALRDELDKSRVWDIRSAKILAEADYDFANTSQQPLTHPRGKKVFLPTSDGILAWDIPTGKEMPPLPGFHSEIGSDPAEIPDVSLDETEALQDTAPPVVEKIESGEILCKVEPAKDESIVAACLSPDGMTAAAADDQGLVRIWTVKTCQLQSTLRPDIGFIKDLRFTPDGHKLLLAAERADKVALYFWDLGPGVKVGQPIVSPTTGANIAFSLRACPFNAAATRLAVIGGNVLQLVDPANARVIGSPGYHRHDITRATFSPDGRLLLTADGESFSLWDAATGDPIVSQIIAPTEDIAFSADSQRIALAGNCYDAKTGLRLTDFTNEADMPNDQRSSPNRDEPTEQRDSFDAFSPDACYFVHISEPTSIRNLPPTAPAPTWLPDLAEAVGGYRLNQGGGLTPVLDRFQRFASLRKTFACTQNKDAWTQIGRWFLTDPVARTINPYSTIKVTDYVAQRLSLPMQESLEQATRVMPDDATTRSQLGLATLESASLTRSLSQIIADHETLLATLLAPNDSKVWDARAKVLTALHRAAESAVAARQGSTTRGR